MTRPASIVWFERLYLGSLAISFVQLVATWKETPALASLDHTLGVIAGVVALVFGLYLLLGLLVARKGSNIAKWAIVVLYVFGLVPAVGMFNSGHLSGWDLVGLAAFAIQGVAIGFSFSPSARAWMGKGTIAAPSGAALKQTFE